MAQNERKDDLEPGQIRYTDGNGNYAVGYNHEGYVYTDPEFTTPIPTGSVVHAGGDYYRKGNYGSYLMGSAADYKDQMQGFMQQIINRKPFEFDLNGDPLYQQFRDQYQKLGKAAMDDTMGQAAGLTGGYGSTYAENAGQQAYHAYLDRLNDVIPDIYAKQRSDYDTATNELYNRWSAANAAYGNAYQEEQAARAAAQNELNAILSAGGTPPDSLIAASGYSKDYVNAMKAYYMYGGAGGSNGGSGGNSNRNTNPDTNKNPDTAPKAYEYTQNELMSLYGDYQAGKLSQDDLDKYVNEYAKKTGTSVAAVWQMLSNSIDGGNNTVGGSGNGGAGGGGRLINRDMPQ